MVIRNTTVQSVLKRFKHLNNTGVGDIGLKHFSTIDGAQALENEQMSADFHTVATNPSQTAVEYGTHRRK